MGKKIISNNSKNGEIINKVNDFTKLKNIIIDYYNEYCSESQLN